jgi:hypothetical protein
MRVPFQLHLFDALKVRCDRRAATSASALPGCICSMHWKFVATLVMGSQRIPDLVASVRCTGSPLRLVRQDREEQRLQRVASVRCTDSPLPHMALKWEVNLDELHLSDALKVQCDQGEGFLVALVQWLHLLDALNVCCDPACKTILLSTGWPMEIANLIFSTPPSRTLTQLAGADHVSRRAMRVHCELGLQIPASASVRPGRLSDRRAKSGA